MKTLLAIFFGYILAAMWSEHVSFDLRETDWYNLWTYFWIVFSPIITFLSFGLFVAAMAAVLER